MPLPQATKLGPYEITGALGAGGMGEVYRARDSRLGREVAVKILPSSLATDPTSLKRFEQEARAAAALNHPNILAVYDVGTYQPIRTDGSSAVAVASECSYIVSELCEGTTLREKLRAGPLPIRKAIDYAQQIARGLAAAHDKGIIHRDLKPENIFITNDGRVKILDFGLAKLLPIDGGMDGNTMSQFVESVAGTVLGTVGYMSPEQVRGKPADARSDIFSLGAILYEMVTGRRAFQGESAADTMSAILKEEPPDLTQTNRAVPPSLEYIVRHCLEKNPVERLQSARDAAFDLGLLSADSATAPAAIPAGPERRSMRWKLFAALGALALLIFAGAYLIGRLSSSAAQPSAYHQLTFQHGLVSSARFAPDGHTVLYAAEWQGAEEEIFSTRDDTRGSLALGIRKGEIAGISPKGDVGILTNVHRLAGWSAVGTLAMTSVNGGAPRSVSEDVGAMAWTPDGNSYALVRYANNRYQLEYPIGKKLFSTVGWISHPRFSPKGDLIAFIHHPQLGDDRGEIAVVDLAGKSRVLANGYASAQGLAWMGDEIWFTASDTGTITALRAVDRNGKNRVVARAPGRLILHDIAQDGRAIVTEESARRAIMVSVAGQKERDLALLDWSLLNGISSDGKYVLLTEEGEGGGPNYSVYLRNVQDGSAIRLGDGEGWALSTDGKWVLADTVTTPQQVLLLPTGAGEPKHLNIGNLRLEHGQLTPDGTRAVIAATDPSGVIRVYSVDVNGGSPKAITPPGVAGSRLLRISPDNKWVLVSDQAKWWLYPLDGGEPREARGLNKEDGPAGWSQDGDFVYAGPVGIAPARVDRVNIVTGKRDFCCEFAPADITGARSGLGPVILDKDKGIYAYGFSRVTSNLYLLDAPSK